MILMDLRFAAEDLDAEPVEARDVPGALAAIDGNAPDVAVLDVNLGRGATCAPVAERLHDLGVPFLLHTGDLHRQGELVAGLGAPVVPKPTPGPAVIRQALALLK